jgi:hypothetical protein
MNGCCTPHYATDKILSEGVILVKENEQNKEQINQAIIVNS